jgi:hypothetical protein
MGSDEKIMKVNLMVENIPDAMIRNCFFSDWMRERKTCLPSPLSHQNTQYPNL